MSAERIDDLERKLAARQGQPGYKRNCQHIQAELSRLRREVTLPEGGDRVQA